MTHQSNTLLEQKFIGKLMLLKEIVYLLNVVLQHLSYSISNLFACSIYIYIYTPFHISVSISAEPVPVFL